MNEQLNILLNDTGFPLINVCKQALWVPHPWSLRVSLEIGLKKKHRNVQIIFAGTITSALYINLLWTLTNASTLVCWARLAPHIPPFQFHTNDFSFLFPTSPSTNSSPPQIPPKSPPSFHISQFPPKKHMVPLSPGEQLSGGWSNFLICQFGNDHCLLAFLTLCLSLLLFLTLPLKART